MPPTEFDNRDAVARTDQALQDAAEQESALRNTVKGLKMRVIAAEEAVRTAKLATAPTPVSPETSTRRRSIKSSSDAGTGTNGPILSDAPTTILSVPSVPRTQTRDVGTSTGPRRTPTLSTYTEQSSYQHTEPYFRFADAAADAERRGANAQRAIQDANTSIAHSASVSREAQNQLRAAQLALDNVKSELRVTQEAASVQISMLQQDVQNKDYALIDQISATQRAQESADELQFEMGYALEREKLATERQKKATQHVVKQRRKDSVLHARHASSLSKRLDEKTKRTTFLQRFYKPDPAQRRSWDVDISGRGYARKVHFGAGQPGPGSN